MKCTWDHDLSFPCIGEEQQHCPNKDGTDAITLTLHSTHSYVGISGFLLLEIVFSEEVCELRPDASQRLGVPMKQQHHIHHRETLTHQGEQVPKEPYHEITTMVISVNCKNLLGTISSFKDSPTASPEPGANRLLVWDSLWMNWAMLSPLPCCAPKDLIMVDSTPCIMPENKSGLRESPAGLLPVWEGAGPMDWWRSEALGPGAGGCAETTPVAHWLVQTVFILRFRNV